ncbi:Adenine phosphoribosyl transferase [mine drainage metagenome]|uniref:adenine phosphoribosyltransferase n=1 Tax=mine drainage metagenome TaxID=410659 RepID=T1AR86_9ZZZZ
MEIEEFVRSKLRDVPDYPKKGIVFKDITPLLLDSQAFSITIDYLANRVSGRRIDKIAGIEARGFIIGAALAYVLKCAFIPIRKAGKLPYYKISTAYDLEYGHQEIEVHKDAIKEGDNVLIADDLLATGGTALAALQLVNTLKGNVAGFVFVTELKDLNGKERLRPYDVISIVKC